MSASLTKDELRSALVNHGIELPLSSAKKDELLALYDEYVGPVEAVHGEFSGDDDEEQQPIKKTSRSSKKSDTTASKKMAKIDTLTEENSMTVGQIQVDDLDDDQLAAHLRRLGVDVGPVVDSTRAFYQKKLAIVLREEMEGGGGGQETNGHGESNGSTKEKQNGEFSADDDQVLEEEEIQPSVVTKKSSRKNTPKKITSSSSAAAEESVSPIKSIGNSIRQRFAATDSGTERSERFTPTPRRSIHSYKVTETTKQTMVKSPDGNITHDLTYNKETSQSQGEIGGYSRAVKILRLLPGFFVLLIVIALVYYMGSKYIPENAVDTAKGLFNQLMDGLFKNSNNTHSSSVDTTTSDETREPPSVANI